MKQKAIWLNWGVFTTEKRAVRIWAKDLRAQSLSLQHQWLWRFIMEDGALLKEVIVMTYELLNPELPSNHSFLVFLASGNI